MTREQELALRAAFWLGYPCFSCLADKRPATPHGFKDACTATTGLATRWARYPGELIGVPTGAASGISVLDIDKKSAGGAWWEANKDSLPATRLHRTRSGGLHALFRHKDGLRNSAGKIVLGVDGRATGGYIIWWPGAGLEAIDAPLADWPDWLMPPLKAPMAPTASAAPAASFIRHYGLFAGTVRARNIERVRQALAAPERSPAETDCDFEDRDIEGLSSGRRCPCCGGQMIIVETFEGVRPARSPAPTRIRIDTS
jgi:Bifunctional DNA primase/polymerase, N-terminal